LYSRPEAHVCVCILELGSPPPTCLPACRTGISLKSQTILGQGKRKLAAESRRFSGSRHCRMPHQLQGSHHFRRSTYCSTVPQTPSRLSSSMTPARAGSRARLNPTQSAGNPTALVWGLLSWVVWVAPRERPKIAQDPVSGTTPLNDAPPPAALGEIS
jgi:hypothetical protein